MIRTIPTPQPGYSVRSIIQRVKASAYLGACNPCPGPPSRLSILTAWAKDRERQNVNNLQS